MQWDSISVWRGFLPCFPLTLHTTTWEYFFYVFVVLTNCMKRFFPQRYNLELFSVCVFSVLIIAFEHCWFLQQFFALLLMHQQNYSGRIRLFTWCAFTWCSETVLCLIKRSQFEFIFPLLSIDLYLFRIVFNSFTWIVF